jgi:DeoR/GlpR family transcriptional regulator of sugar metabolism
VPVADRLDVTLRLVRSLSVRGSASLAELAQRLGVSEMTVRRDLDELQRRGLVRRVRGGAVALEQPGTGFAARAGWQSKTKDRLGRAVAAQIPSGSTVLLDAGTTTVHVAAHLVARAPLTIAVLSLQVAQRLADQPGIRLLVLGGESRPGEHSLVGPLTASTLRRLSFDHFVMSIGGVNAEQGFTEFALDDAAVKQVGLEQSAHTVVVADATKLGVRALARVAGLDAADGFVTDASARDPRITPAAEQTLTALHDSKVEVTFA